METRVSEQKFSGSDYDQERDSERLSTQMERVRIALSPGHWLTVRQIADRIGDPENSIQAQLRNLRKKCNGGYIVEKEICGNGSLYQYRMRERTADDPPPPEANSSTKAMRLQVARLSEALVKISIHSTCSRSRATAKAALK